MISSVILGSKLSPIRVFIGASLAFLVQVIISVSVGGMVSKVPKRPLDLAIGVVFLIGAALIFRDVTRHTAEKEEALAKRQSREGLIPQTFLAFAITFVGEFGDLTQIATANLAAKTGDPLLVGVGAFLGLLASSGMGIFLGAQVLSKVPIKAVQLISILIMASLGVFTMASALLQ